MTALSAAAEEQVSELSDPALAEGFAALQKASEMASAQRLRRLSEIDRRKSYGKDGHLSATSWLVAEYKVGGGEAAGAVKMARALEAMPATARALARGQVTTSAVKILAAAREASPHAFAQDEGMLVGAARHQTVAGLTRLTSSWRQRVGPHGARGEWERLRQARRLSMCPAASGMVRVEGEFDPEVGEAVMTAVKAVMDAEVRTPHDPDLRTGPQRRADALGQICRTYLARRDRPLVGQERPHVTVTVDVEALRGGSGMCGLDHAGPIPGEIARRVSCDAALTRVLVTGRSEPLDVGRRTSVVPAGLRRAVVVRDGGCRFPGCDRPPGWCQCHHVVHWADGGPTALANLVLVCQRQPLAASRGRIHPRDGWWRADLPAA